MALPVAMTAAGSVTGTSAGASSLLPGLVSAGGSILGGTISSLFNRSSVKEQTAFQREAMQNGIQWRVADAKAAGLHPLFALGANLPTPAPMVLGDQLGPALAEAGQSIGNALSRQESQHDRAMRMMDYEVATATRRKIDAEASFAEAQAFASWRALEGQAQQSGLGVQGETNPMGQAPNPPGNGVGQIDLKPSEVISHKQDAPHVSAGMNPAYEERWLAEGFPIMLPVASGESPEEIISEMSIPAWLGLLSRNSQIYGTGWAEDMFKLRYAGIHPKRRYKSINESEGRGRAK